MFVLAGLVCFGSFFVFSGLGVLGFLVVLGDLGVFRLSCEYSGDLRIHCMRYYSL